MSRLQEAAGPSRPTQTITVRDDTTDQRAGTLRLRGHNTDPRRVAWTQNTVDNEHLGRKSSKICCIYHKPKDFDESSSSDSSSDSDSQDTGDEHDNVKRKLKEKIQRKKMEKHAGPCEHGHGSSESDEKPDSDASGTSRNAYEKGVK